MAAGQYIRIRYLNSFDFQGLIFSDGYYQDLFLEGMIGDLKCETIEYGDKNENNEFFKTKVIKEFSVTIKTIGVEELFKTLHLISLCNNILISNKLNEMDQVLEMKVEADPKEITMINVKFILRRIVWNSCNNEIISRLTCPVSTQDLVGTILITNPSYTTPPYNLTNIGEYYAINDVPNGKFFIAKRVSGGWENVTPSILSRYKDLNQTDFYYVLKKNEPAGAYVPVTQFPTLTTITNNMNGTLTATGECVDGYFLQVYESSDNITYTAIGSIVNASIFNVNGLTFTPSNGKSYFKLALIDYTFTVCLYTASIHLTQGLVKFVITDSVTGLPIPNASCELYLGVTFLESVTTNASGIACTGLYNFDNYNYLVGAAGYNASGSIGVTLDGAVETVNQTLVPL